MGRPSKALSIKFFEPRIGGDPAKTVAEHVAIVDLDDWEAYHLQWVSPLRQVIKYPTTFFGKHPFAVRAIVHGEPKKIMEVCAENAFYDWGITFAKRLADHLGVDIADCETLFQILFALVKAILKLSDHETLEILKKRLVALAKPTPGCFDALAECDEALHYATKEEQETLNEEKSKVVKQQGNRAQFVDEYKQKYSAIKQIARADGKMKVGEKTKFLKKAMVGKLPVVPSVVEMTVEEALMCAPPDTMLCIETRDQCWRGSWSTYDRTSRAFNLYGGQKAACVSLLQFLWRLFLEENGLSISDCPVKGIYEEAST